MFVCLFSVCSNFFSETTGLILLKFYMGFCNHKTQRSKEDGVEISMIMHTIFFILHLLVALYPLVGKLKDMESLMYDSNPFLHRIVTFYHF